jgi:acyl-CoA thioester hydrolase
MNKPAPLARDTFNTFITMPTRWADNDVYGHVNNVTYYSYFDTAVNQWLITQGLLDIHSADESLPVGLVVANRCQFFAALAFPQSLDIGLRIEHIGTSSVRFVLGVFAANTPMAAAVGEFTHVYVHRHSRKPMPLPAHWRSIFLTLQPQP